MFGRSADQAEAAPPGVAGEGFPVPPVPPETPEPSGQRHFNVVFVLVTVGVLVALVAGLLAYTHISDTHAAKARAAANARAAAAAQQAATAAQVDAVRQAYLAYWTALGQAELQGDPAPLEPLETPAGFAGDRKAILTARTTGYRYRLTADQHDMQVVVYAGGALASVDDVLMEHNTNLDAVSLQPVPELKPVDTPAHLSTAFVLQNGHWLYDSEISFGSDGSDPKEGVSYAVLSRNNPIPPDLRRQIEQGYLAYEDGFKTALQNLDPTPLQAVAGQPELSAALTFLNQLKAKNQGLAKRLQHNYRVALKDAQTAYVYDTLADDSFFFNFSTKAQLPTDPTSIVREDFELTKVGDRWQVVLVELHS